MTCYNHFILTGCRNCGGNKQRRKYINRFIRGVCGYLFDSVFPLPCFYWTICSMHSIYCIKGILVRNTFSITKVPFQQGVKPWDKKMKTCIVFSNAAPMNKYGLGTFIFQRRGGKMNTDGRVSGFFSNLYLVPILKRFL